MEWRKLFYKKKIWLVFAGLLVLQVILFLYFAQLSEKNEENYVEYEGYDDVEDILTGGEEAGDTDDYAERFHEAVEAVVNQGNSMAQISIFAKSDSFASRNLEKTKSDYTRLLSVEPVAFEDTFLTEFLNDSLLNGMVVLCGLLLAMVYVDEKRTGLCGMLFAASGGRAKLVKSRLAAMLFWNAVIVAVFYGITLCISCVRYGGDFAACVSYPVQSIEMLADLPWTITIGEFLLFYFAYRWLLLCLITWMAWCFLSALDHVILAFGLLGGVGLAEYLMAAWIGKEHPLAFFHYVNLWYLMYDSSFFAEYRNLNIFGAAVNKNAAAAAAWLILAAVLAAIAFINGIKRYPCASSAGRMKRFVEKSGRAFQYLRGSIMERLSITGAEYYKTLVSQRGILLFVLFAAVLVSRTNFTTVTRTAAQDLYYEFLDSYTGVPDEASAEYLAQLEAEVLNVEEEYLDALEKYENDEIDFDSVYAVNLRYMAYVGERQFLAQMKEQTEYLAKLKENAGIDGWYINTYTYTNLLGQDDTLMDIVLMLCIVLLCSGIFAHEKQCGILPVLHGTAEGREKLFYKKLRFAAALTVLLYLAAQGLSAASVIYTYGIRAAGAPVQSLPALSFLPFSCSIGVFLIVLYLLRAAVLLAAAAFTCMISTYASQKATVLAALLLCVPSVLSLAGFDFLNYFSIVRVLSVAPFLVQVQSVGAAAAVYAVFLVVGAFSIWKGYRRWCVT